MNCREVTTRLDDWLDGQLAADEAERIAHHLDECPCCEAEAAREWALRTALRALPVPPPPPGFADRVLANAVRMPRGRRTGLAIAASLVLGIAVGLSVSLPRQAPMQSLPGITLAVAQPRNVNLVFESTQALQQVEFTIRLPEGVEVVGYPRQRELTWSAGLERGKNQLTLPLVIQAGTGGDVVAELVHGKQRKHFNLRVTTDHIRDAGAPSLRIPV